MISFARFFVWVAPVAASISPLPALAQQVPRLQCAFAFPGKAPLSFEFAFDEASSRATVLDLNRAQEQSVSVNATFTAEIVQILFQPNRIAFVINRRDFRGAMVSQDESAYTVCEVLPVVVPVPVEVPRQQRVPVGPCYSGYCPCDRADPDYGGIDVPLCTMIGRGQQPSSEQVMFGEMARDARRQIRESGF